MLCEIVIIKMQKTSFIVLALTVTLTSGINLGSSGPIIFANWHCPSKGGQFFTEAGTGWSDEETCVAAD